MEYSAILDYPLVDVFAHLAAPERLGDVLPELLHVQCMDGQTPEICDAFHLVVQVEGIQHPAQGEMIAFEPPGIVAYRFFVGEIAQVVRMACMTSDAGTRVRITINGESRLLTVDLAVLARALSLRALGATPNRNDAISEQSA